MMKVSIIVASYNYACYLRETLDSLLAQTLCDWEALVVDDGSTDESIDIIREYSRRDSRIRLLQHAGGVNRGLPATVQLGVSEARGEFIAFCESDDCLLPRSLEKQAAVLDQYPDVALSFSLVELIGDPSHKKFYERYWKKIVGFFPDDDLPVPAAPLLEFQNPIFTFSCVMVRASLLKHCDFESPVAPFLDWWLWRQIGRGHRMFFLREPLTQWRVHGESLMHVAGNSKDNYEYFLESARERESEDTRIDSTPASLTVLIGEGKMKYLGLTVFCWKKTSEYHEYWFPGFFHRKIYRIPLLNQIRRKAFKYRKLSLLPIPFLRSQWMDKKMKYELIYERLDSLI